MILDPLIVDRVCAIVAQVAGRRREPVRVDRETPLREGLWLDSMELLEVVIACEEQFDLEFEERDLSPDALATAGTLAALVARRAAHRSA